MLRVHPRTAVRPLLMLAVALTLPTPSSAGESLLEFPSALTRLSPSQKQQLSTLLADHQVTQAEILHAAVPDDLLATGVLKLDLPGHGGFLLRETYREHPSSDSVAWFGRSENGIAEAGLLLRSGRITGRLSADGFEYQLAPLGDGLHALVRLELDEDPSNSFDHPPDAVSEIEPQASESRVTPRHGHNCGFDRTGWVDVLSVFTPDVTASGQVNDLHDRVLWGISDFNASLTNSQVARRDVRLRLVGFEEAMIAEDGMIEEVSLRLRTNQGVAQRRDTLNADLVVLHTAREEFPTMFTGGTSGGFVPEIPASPATAFAVVGGTSWAPFHRRTFHHEIGHLFGGVHHDGTPPSGHPSYSRGFQRKGFRSIMVGGKVARWPHFSSDTVLHNGGSTGTAMSNDVARLLGERGPLVATFEQDPLEPLSLSIEGPGNVAPGGSGTWIARVCGGIGPFSVEWRTTTNGVDYTGVLSTSHSFQATMPGFFMIIKATATDGTGATTNSYKYVVGY